MKQFLSKKVTSSGYFTMTFARFPETLVYRRTVNGHFCSVDKDASIHLRMAVLFV